MITTAKIGLAIRMVGISLIMHGAMVCSFSIAGTAVL